MLAANMCQPGARVLLCRRIYSCLYDADEDKPETNAPLGQTPRTETAPETASGHASSNRANLHPSSSHAVTTCTAPNGATAEPITFLNLFRLGGPTASSRHELLLDTVVPGRNPPA